MTTRKQRKSKQNKRRATICAVLSLFLILGSVFISDNDSRAVATEEANTKITITIQEGDTLWNIARKYGGGTDPREFIYNLQELNNLEAPIIYPGQSLVVPVS